MSELNGSPKKRKLEKIDGHKILSAIQFDKVLRIDSERKNAFLVGTGEEGCAVVALEKQPFSEETVKLILSDSVESEIIFKNDIYHTFKLFPQKDNNC